MHSADYAIARCLTVRLSHAGIVSKRLHISSKFFSPLASPTILDGMRCNRLLATSMPLCCTACTQEYFVLCVRTEILYCQRDSCQYRGVCRETAADYTCDCCPAFAGDRCEKVTGYRTPDVEFCDSTRDSCYHTRGEVVPSIYYAPAHREGGGQ